MKKLLLAIPAAMLVAAPASSGEKIQLTEKQQAKLDKRLEGRTAGDPVSCISLRDQKNMTVISDDVLLFGASRNAKTIYVNKPLHGCRNADRLVMVYDRPTSNLCRGEIVQLVDNTTGANLGSCAFSEFVPYTKNDG